MILSCPLLKNIPELVRTLQHVDTNVDNQAKNDTGRTAVKRINSNFFGKNLLTCKYKQWTESEEQTCYLYSCLSCCQQLPILPCEVWQDLSDACILPWTVKNMDSIVSYKSTWSYNWCRDWSLTKLKPITCRKLWYYHWTLYSPFWKGALYN